MNATDVITLIGAIATFLFGMSTMTDGLEKLSSGRLEGILERLTSNVFKGVLLGALVTGLIQSSAATTVMCVGFVNAGIMKLPQTVGIIMGANIGTTLTAWIMSAGFSFNITDFVWPAFFIAIILIYSKKRKIIGAEFIRVFEEEARKLEDHARSQIEKAIVDGKFYVHGEVLNLKSGSAKDKIDAAMKSLVESVYSKLNMVNQFADTDADVFSILNSPQDEITFTGLGANNEDALNDISQWLELQNQKMLKTSMGDVQRRYQAIPYGWKEIDIAALIARLIVQQKIQINYGGAMVGKDDHRLVDFLRKRTEIDKAIVVRHIAPDETLIRKSVAFLREYLGAMDIPSDENGLIGFVLNTFETYHFYKIYKQHCNIKIYF